METLGIRKINSSGVYYTGSTWPCLDGDTFTIIGQSTDYYLSTKGSKDYIYFICEFPKGHRRKIQNSHITSGKVKDPYYPSVLGKGMIGQGKWLVSIGNKHTREYSLWKAMLYRCYSKFIPKKSRKNNTYRDVEVADRWLDFQVFCEDIQYLEGYMLWRDENNEYQLDKDLINPLSRSYSRDTCSFISDIENYLISSLTGKTYEGYNSLLNYREEFRCISKFCSTYGLNSSVVVQIIKKQYCSKKFKGWTFKIIKDV